MTYRIHGYSLAAVLVVAVVCTPVAAGSLPFERSQILATSGDSTQVDLDMYSFLPGPGRVFLQPLGREGATAIRLGFRIKIPAPQGSGWSIKILDSSRQERWSIDSDSVAEEQFWSDEIAGKTVWVELHSTVADNPVMITIERMAYSQEPAVPYAITGESHLTSIGLFTDEIKELGRSVAKLKFIGDDGPIYNCTGFLIATDLLLTNEHCISTETERRSAMVYFDFDTKLADTTRVRLSGIVKSDHALDYSVVKLRQPIDRSPLVFADDLIEADAELIIIQHPGGEPKQVSKRDCKVADPLVEGRGNTESDFSHLCDTLGGSSGAPVFLIIERAGEADEMKLVGLHHLGFEETDLVLQNRAVHINQLKADFPAGVLTGLTPEHTTGSPQ